MCLHGYYLPCKRATINHVNTLHERHPTMFNFEDQILKAAEFLKEERDLLAQKQEIAALISNWIEEQLEDIDWHYCNSQALQKKVFKLELEAEKTLLEIEELAAA